MPTKIESEKIIEDILSTAKKLNVNSLAAEDYLKNGNFSYGPLIACFGSVKKAFMAAGLLEHKSRRKIIQKEDIIKDIQNIAKKINRNSLSCLIYEKNGGKFSREVIEKNFISYQNAFTAAGLNKHINTKIISNDIIINDLRNVYKILNRGFSQEEYIKYGQYGKNTLSYKFGSFKKALFAANIEPYKRGWRKYTKDELLIFLKKFFKEFGHAPTVIELSQNERYPSERPYWNTFPNKTWAEILVLAGLSSDFKTRGKDGVFYDSNMECLLANQLYNNFISYEPHKKVCNDRLWMCDFYLKDKDIWIEFDGLRKSRKEPYRYQEKLQYYKDNKFNFIELHDGDNVFEKCNLYFQIENPTIKNISFNEADNFLVRTHYLGNATRGSQYYGAFISKQLVGVICLGKTANPFEKALAITRIAWLDRVRNNKNFGSSFISKVLKIIKKNGYSGPIVSWSDPRFHLGTLYKACNFIQIPTKQRRDYIYFDVNGNEYHKSRCRVPAGQSEADYAQKLGLTKIIIPPKQKWGISI